MLNSTATATLKSKKNKKNLKLFTKNHAKTEEDDNERPRTATLDKPKIINVRLVSKIDMSLITKEFLLSITNLYRPSFLFDASRPKSKLSKGNKKKGNRGFDQTVTPLLINAWSSIKSGKKEIKPKIAITAAGKCKKTSDGNDKKRKSPISSDTNNSSSTPSSSSILSPINPDFNNRRSGTTARRRRTTERQTIATTTQQIANPKRKQLLLPIDYNNYDSETTTQLFAKRSLFVSNKSNRKTLQAPDLILTDIIRSEDEAVSKIRTVETGKNRPTRSSVARSNKKDDNNNTRSGADNEKQASTDKECHHRVPNQKNGHVKAKRIDIPEPCRTCGREDAPERLHSHPKTNRTITKQLLPNEKQQLPMKSVVQKPVAIRYRKTDNNIRNKKRTNNVSDDASPQSDDVIKVPIEMSKLRKKTVVQTASKTFGGDGVALWKKVDDEFRRSGRKAAESPGNGNGTTVNKHRPRFLMCYICGREFGTSSLPLHEPKCLEKWTRENEELSPKLRRKVPVKPLNNLTREEWNQYAWETSQANLVPCDNCGRTFFPDRLVVHQRSCLKTKRNVVSVSPSNWNGAVIEIGGGAGTIKMAKQSSVSTRSTPPSSASSSLIVRDQVKSIRTDRPSTAVRCKLCGRLFGSRSIKIHEPQCLKRWQAENERLPPNQRLTSPPRHFDNDDDHSIGPSGSNRELVDGEESHGKTTKSPLIVCYVCGKTFDVHAIYAHEPECLKRWKAENERLPPDRRQVEPRGRSDIKFTASGGVDYLGTFQRIWENHLSSLIVCERCGRTFFPDRIERHRNACNGLGIKRPSKK